MTQFQFSTNESPSDLIAHGATIVRCYDTVVNGLVTVVALPDGTVQLRKSGYGRLGGLGLYVLPDATLVEAGHGDPHYPGTVRIVPAERQPKPPCQCMPGDPDLEVWWAVRDRRCPRIFRGAPTGVDIMEVIDADID